MLLIKAAAPGHSMIFLWNHYPHTISSGTDSKLSVVLICIFIYRAPHIGFLYSDAHFLVICYPEPIYFLKKKENQVKIPSIFFSRNTIIPKRVPKPNIFLKNFSNRVASDRKPSMFFFRML